MTFTADLGQGDELSPARKKAEMMGVKQITLVGFDHFKKDRSRLHHYWINKTTTRPKEHDGDAEELLFQELVKAGRVRYI